MLNFSGLNRCRKSCRLRWLNYLKPNIKRGEFAEDEVDLMIRLHTLLGNRLEFICYYICTYSIDEAKLFPKQETKEYAFFD